MAEPTRRIAWDWDELTPREALDLEDAAGAVVPAIIASIQAGLPSTRMLAAVAWIARRRHGEDDLTFEQVVDEHATYNALAVSATRTVRPPDDDDDGED